ncbi:MAG: DUF192 domain-containing protein [Phycisphaerae bacterium]
MCGKTRRWAGRCLCVGLVLVPWACNPSTPSSGAGSGTGDSIDESGNVMQDDPTPSDAGADDPADTPPEPPQSPTDDLLDNTENAEYLGSLPLATVTVGDKRFLVWVADTSPTLQRGLMQVTEEELADLPDGTGRGMLFSFEQDSTGGFWMKDTITPLDIAFIDEGGTIVTIHTMAPLDESIYRPTGPYRHALEVTAGTYGALGVAAGQSVVLP